MLEIDLTKSYPHLSKAPIVEAVIEIRANAEKKWVEKDFLVTLKKLVPGYSKISAQHEYKHEIKLRPDKKSEPKVVDPVFKGARIQSESKPQVVQFNRDGFIFSRLKPYETWESLYKESGMLWDIYKKFVCPVTINRVGVRFINKIILPLDKLNMSDYLQGAPKSPGDLNFPFAGFFHQDTLIVPESPYKINLIRTIQNPEQAKGIQLIIDIDIFNDNHYEINDDILLSSLSDMRCLKNVIFFNCITEKTLELLR